MSKVPANLSQHMTRRKKVWEELPEYPGSETGICKASLISYKNEIYVIGGQTGTGANAAALKHIYVFNAESKKWTAKADMKEARTSLATAVCGGKVYVFLRLGQRINWMYMT